MRKLVLSTILLSAILYFVSYVYSEETEEKLLLNNIIENINNYKNKILTIKLRFKDIDNNFDKIIFCERVEEFFFSK